MYSKESPHPSFIRNNNYGTAPNCLTTAARLGTHTSHHLDLPPQAGIQEPAYCSISQASWRSEQLPPPPAYWESPAAVSGTRESSRSSNQASISPSSSLGAPGTQLWRLPNESFERTSFSSLSSSKVFAMASGPLTRPFALPQTGAGGAAPFLRAFSVDLAQIGIQQDEFMHFVDKLNETILPDPELHVAEKAARIAGYIVPHMIPALYGLYAGLSIAGLQVAAVVGGVAQVKGATKKFLKQANQELFAPRGVEVLLIPAKEFNEKVGFEDDLLYKKRGDLQAERKAFEAERKAGRKARKAERAREKQQRKVDKKTAKWEAKQLKRESKGKSRQDIDNLSISSASSGSSSSSADSSDAEAISRQREHMDPISRMEKYSNAIAPLYVSLPPVESRTSAGRTDAMARYGARSMSKEQEKIERKAAKAALKGKMKKTQNVEKGLLWLAVVNKDKKAAPKANYSADAKEEDEYDDDKVQ